MIDRLIPLLACGLSWPCVLAGAGTSPTTSRQAVPPGEYRGRITGQVVSATTGEPIAGAYVGVGDFGDAGGSNLARFEKQGIYADTESDKEGRFELTRLALRDHPLVVTHSEYVRHDETVAIRPGTPEAEVKVRLKPAAKILAAAVDAEGKPLKEPLTIRLEALDGHRFIPPGRHRHLSAFASATWIERDTAGRFLFGELDEGKYSIDVMKVADKEDQEKSAHYHGGIAFIQVKAGETHKVQIKPQDHRNSLQVKLSMPPQERPEAPAFLVINRNPALLLWDDGLIHHPEDDRLGRIALNALFMTGFSPADTFTVNNLPPGVYSFFIGPLVSAKGVKVEVVKGRDTAVTADWVRPEKVARVNLWTFWRRISLPLKEYRAGELCDLVTEKAKPLPQVNVTDAHRNETIRLESPNMMIWEILEAICAQKGWIVREEGDRTLIIGPPFEPEANVFPSPGTSQKVKQ